MKFSRMNVVAILAITAALTGCATQEDRARYTVNGTRAIGSTSGVPVVSGLNLGPLEQSNRRIPGHIIDLKLGQVIVPGDPSAVGLIGGGVVGGVLGNQVGKGNGRKAATVVGALLGAGVGGAVSSNNNNRHVNVYRMKIRLENGQEIDVLQADRGEDFNKGFRVYSSLNSRGVWEVTRNQY